MCAEKQGKTCGFEKGFWIKKKSSVFSNVFVCSKFFFQELSFFKGLLFRNVKMKNYLFSMKKTRTRLSNMDEQQNASTPKKR